MKNERHKKVTRSPGELKRAQGFPSTATYAAEMTSASKSRPKTGQQRYKGNGSAMSQLVLTELQLYCAYKVKEHLYINAAVSTRIKFAEATVPMF